MVANLKYEVSDMLATACELQPACGRATMPTLALGLNADQCERYMHFITNRRYHQPRCGQIGPGAARPRYGESVPVDEREDGPEGEEILRDLSHRIPVRW